MNVCRYAGQYQYECEFVICENRHIKNNMTRSWRNNSENAQKLQDMFCPSLKKHIGEVLYQENPVEYHTFQNHKMSESSHIWTHS